MKTPVGLAVLPMTNAYRLRATLSMLASAWATEAYRYRRGSSQLEDTEQSFWLGMSYAFTDSIDELLLGFENTSVQSVFSLIQTLEHRCAQAIEFQAQLQALPLHCAYIEGMEAAYRTSIDYLNDVVVETMLSVNTRSDDWS